MIDSAPEEVRTLFSKRVKLMAPLLKAWKTALKAENAVDFSGLIHQAINVLDKGRFVSPGSISWWMSFRISHRNAPRCWRHYGGKTHTPPVCGR
jgi:hypothetical protein